MTGACGPYNLGGSATPDSPKCAALRADMEGNRQNSRFQHTHKNKSIKAHELWKENQLSFRMNLII